MEDHCSRSVCVVLSGRAFIYYARGAVIARNKPKTANLALFVALLLLFIYCVGNYNNSTFLSCCGLHLLIYLLYSGVWVSVSLSTSAFVVPELQQATSTLRVCIQISYICYRHLKLLYIYIASRIYRAMVA